MTNFTVDMRLEYKSDFIILPINPESLPVSFPGNNERVNVVGLGEVVVQRKRKLATFSVNSFFPEDTNPEVYIRFIENWRDAKQPGRFSVDGLGFNMQVAIEDFSYEWRHAQEGDRYYEIAFVEAPTYGAKIITLVEENVATPLAPLRIDNAPPVQQTYTVKSGDSLWAIAQRLSGNGDNWRALYEANKVIVGNNPNLIFPGQVYVVPTDWVTTPTTGSPGSGTTQVRKSVAVGTTTAPTYAESVGMTPAEMMKMLQGQAPGGAGVTRTEKTSDFSGGAGRSF